MKKLTLIILLVFCVSIAVNAQDFAYGKWTYEEMGMKKYNKDTSAHAVVLNEYGNAKITVVSSDNIRLVYEYHVRIKIFDENGFKQGTVEIPLYIGNEVGEEADDITAVTMYTDANGAVKTEELDPSKIFKVQENKNHTNVKFAMPGLRNGCVIEYKYKITSPYWDSFHDWQFQSDIPKIHSEYEAHIPGFWTYNAVLRGELKLDKSVSDLEQECFSTHGAKSDCSHLIFGMNNIPAFVEEDYMTAPKNFIAAVYFELSEFTNPYTGIHAKVAKEWTDVDYQLKKDDYFGGQIKKKDQLRDRITPVIAGKTDDMDKAKAVYAYMQKTIKWNDYYSFTSPDGIRKALDKHTGMAGDINLTLVSALNAAGINTEAVLLSTREHGIVNKLYPVITEFNYVIAKANIGDKSYLLDATDPLLSFGILPLRCLNDQGRVMSLDKPSYWIDITNPQTQSSTHTLTLALQENGKLKGTLINYFKGYAAYVERKAIKKFNTTDEYVENLDEKLTKVKITKSAINNIDSLDMPLTETYEVEIDAFDNLNHNKLSFNPFIFGRIITNPFKLADRTYPVDWGMPSETRFILNMKLPEGYIVENPPQNGGLVMPRNAGRFAIAYDGSGSSFTFSHVIQFNKSVYESAEYPFLKELYNKIILSEKTEMVFKKKI